MMTVPNSKDNATHLDILRPEIRNVTQPKDVVLISLKIGLPRFQLLFRKAHTHMAALDGAGYGCPQFERGHQ